MCIVAILKDPCAGVSFALASNRDEFYARPADPVHEWEDRSGIVAPRDQSGGGTWLGMHVTGTYAVVLNYRAPLLDATHTYSRGLIARDFLESPSSPREFLEELRTQIPKYNPFTLIVGDLTSGETLALHSVNGQILKLQEKIIVMSNGPIDAKWPKQQRLSELIAGMSLNKADITTQLLGALQDRWIPADNQLPTTGVTLDQERMLSTIFVTSPLYGTCSSAVITCDNQRDITFTERRTTAGAPCTEQTLTFRQAHG